MCCGLIVGWLIYVGLLTYVVDWLCVFLVCLPGLGFGWFGVVFTVGDC